MGFKEYCVVSGVLFALVACAHLLRIVNGMSVHVDDYAVPMFASWIAFVLPGALAFWAFRLSSKTGSA